MEHACLKEAWMHDFCTCSEFLTSSTIVVQVNLTCTVTNANLNKSSINVPTAWTAWFVCYQLKYRIKVQKHLLAKLPERVWKGPDPFSLLKLQCCWYKLDDTKGASFLTHKKTTSETTDSSWASLHQGWYSQHSTSCQACLPGVSCSCVCFVLSGVSWHFLTAVTWRYKSKGSSTACPYIYTQPHIQQSTWRSILTWPHCL